MAVWLCREFSCSIPSFSIYYALETNIRVKSYDHLNFLRPSVVQFWASSYIVVLNHTPESKVMAVWIWRELLCSISSISIQYWPESDIWVICYDRLNLPRASKLFNLYRLSWGVRYFEFVGYYSDWIFVPWSLNANFCFHDVWEIGPSYSLVHEVVVW